MVSVIDDEEAFELLNHDKKNRTKFLLKRESGKKNVTFKILAEKVNISCFNTITLINEIELYPEWFPFCKNSTSLKTISKSKKVVD